MDELGDGMFELQRKVCLVFSEPWKRCGAGRRKLMTEEVRTREAGKSAGQVMIGVHVTFALPYVVGLQRLGLNRGRAMARGEVPNG